MRLATCDCLRQPHLAPDFRRYFGAESIRTNVGNLRISHETSPPSGFVTISLGVATTSADVPVSREDLTRQADSVMYVAKEKGRNRVEA